LFVALFRRGGRPTRPAGLVGRVEIESQLADEPGEGDPRVALNRHFRPCPRLVESVDVYRAMAGNRLAGLDPAVPGFRREREDPKVMSLEGVVGRDRLPPCRRIGPEVIRRGKS
jgi:hypothetical protein